MNRPSEDVFDNNSWAEAERLHPGCSAAWDRDGGPAWTLDSTGKPYPSLTICVSPTNLAVGCNDHVPFRWAFWLSGDERWCFLPDDSAIHRFGPGALAPWIGV